MAQMEWAGFGPVPLSITIKKVHRFQKCWEIRESEEVLHWAENIKGNISDMFRVLKDFDLIDNQMVKT